MTNTHSAAALLLATLKAQGIDYFFANGGTDFPPVVEAFALADPGTVPRPMVIPHETVAVAMAHGYYAVSGRPQAVMVHVNVGTANALNCLCNAARDNVPLLLMAGRAPVTEHGRFGGRSRYIHWAQEMFDQAGMLREITQWEYELRFPEQAGDAVRRAMEIAMAHPRGPVYLQLPRETLAAPAPSESAPPPRAVPAPPRADPADLATLSGWIANASFPLVITSAIGRDAAAVEALSRLAERWAIPVICVAPRYLCLPTDHPMHLGFAQSPVLAEADLVICLEADVPWYPQFESPKPGARVAHIGLDPLFSRYPMRSCHSDLTIAADPAAVLTELDRALEGRADASAVGRRRATIAQRSERQRAAWNAQARSSNPITPEWISRCISQAKDDNTIVVNEYPLRLEHCRFTQPGTYFGISSAGGLGWGLGAALGAKLAAPDRLVIAALGDGSYIFSNPTAAHWVALAHRLPILTVVYNNSRWGAVHKATLAMYGGGAAARSGQALLADLSPSPAYEKIVDAHGGHGERVERAGELPHALARAIAAVRAGRQALLNVVCVY